MAIQCNVCLYFAVSLGVELQREQSANITAIKFPVKKQNCTTESTFKSAFSGKESEGSATETEVNRVWLLILKVF